MVPMQKALFTRTRSRLLPVYNMKYSRSIPYGQFEREFTEKWIEGEEYYATNWCHDAPMIMGGNECPVQKTWISLTHNPFRVRFKWPLARVGSAIAFSFQEPNIVQTLRLRWSLRRRWSPKRGSHVRHDPCRSILLMRGPLCEKGICSKPIC